MHVWNFSRLKQTQRHSHLAGLNVYQGFTGDGNGPAILDEGSA